MTAPKRFYFEDFVPGRVWEARSPVLTSEEIIDFGRKFDPQDFHTDENKAKQTVYGGLIASGWHTLSLSMRMICDSFLIDADSLGSPGLEKLRWTKPVRPGDSLRLRMTVREATPSRTRPDRGTVLSLCEVYNQHDELVMTMEGYTIFGRRDAALPT